MPDGARDLGRGHHRLDLQLPIGLRHTASVWLYAGFAAALAQVAWHYTLIRTRQRPGCFTAFSKSHWISFAVFVGIVLGLAR